MLSIISTMHKLNSAQIMRERLEKIDCQHKSALWGDKDLAFDLGLEKFGLDINAIRNTPTVPERIFRGWIEDWEKELFTVNDAVAKYKLLQKYKGLVFTDDKHETTYTISTTKMYWKSYLGGGWCVICEPPEYDRKNEDILEFYQLKWDDLLT